MSTVVQFPHEGFVMQDALHSTFKARLMRHVSDEAEVLADAVEAVEQKVDKQAKALQEVLRRQKDAWP